MKLAFIGGGNMAEAMLQGVLSSKLFAAKNISVTDILAERLQYLQKKYQVQTNLNNLQVLKNADVIVLAVKPQVIDSVLAEIKAVNNTDQLLISVVAGLPLDKFDIDGKCRAVRVMLNTPALISQSASAFCCNAKVTQQDKKFIFHQHPPCNC
jgi:pyrroline-5-carboxylate reductase